MGIEADSFSTAGEEVRKSEPILDSATVTNDDALPPPKKSKYCRNCRLHENTCLHGKLLLKVTERTSGMFVKTCGSAWAFDKRGMLAQVISGDNQYVKILWMNEPIFEIFSLTSKGEYVFQFCCSKEEIYESEEKNLHNYKPKYCSNCKLQNHKCLDGKLVSNVFDKTNGMRVRPVGGFWPPQMLNKTGIVIGGNSHKINIKWQNCFHGSEILDYKSKNQFLFDCRPLDDDPKLSTMVFSQSAKESNSLKLQPKPSTVLVAHTAVRLPVRKAIKEVWRHEAEGEKHRIIFCASDNVNLRAIGLLVEEKINKVILNICKKSTVNNNKEFMVIFKQDFDNVEAIESGNKSGNTRILNLRDQVPLNCEGMYLLVLTLFGGASIVGHGGEEFINVKTDANEVLFKFEDFPHKDSKRNKSTNVESGVLEKLYFNL